MGVEYWRYTGRVGGFASRTIGKTQWGIRDMLWYCTTKRSLQAITMRQIDALNADFEWITCNIYNQTSA